MSAVEVRLTPQQAAILLDVLNMVLNDPDWQELASATAGEWRALGNAASAIYGATQTPTRRSAR